MLGEIFKKSGPIAWLYKYTNISDELDESMCAVFWTNMFGLVVVLATLPVTGLMLLYRPYRKNPNEFGGLASALGLTLVLLILSGLGFMVYQDGLIESLISMGIWMIVVGICMGCLYLFTVIIKFIDKILVKIRGEKTPKPKKVKIKKDSEVKRFIKNGWDAWIKDYCPKIDWK